MILIPVFRAPNTRISHQDAMESSSVRAVRRLVSQQKVYCKSVRINYHFHGLTVKPIKEILLIR